MHKLSPVSFGNVYLSQASFREQNKKLIDNKQALLYSPRKAKSTDFLPVTDLNLKENPKKYVVELPILLSPYDYFPTPLYITNEGGTLEKIQQKVTEAHGFMRTVEWIKQGLAAWDKAATSNAQEDVKNKYFTVIA